MSALDRIAIDELGIPSLVLMEVAGRAVADRAEHALAAVRGSTGEGVLAISGLGNNGGDAVVAARHLADRGVPVVLVVVGDVARESRDLAAELAIARRLGVDPVRITSDAELPALRALISRAAVVIDGLFGTGLARPIEGLEARVIEAINLSGRHVLAVDVPSGVDADSGRILGTAVRAAETVTFQHAKLGHVIHPGRDHTGALTVADIGIPRSLLARISPRAEVVEPDVVRQALPPRRADTHKGTYGHLLIVAGAPDRPGSALLAGRAALRIGSGLVTIASDAETIARLAPELVELMGLSAGASRPGAAAILEGLTSRSALAIGPSLAPDPETAALVREVLEGTRVPAVVDAGALAALGAETSWIRRRPAPTILTPHPGEAARLAGIETARVQSDRVRVARDLAAGSGAYVVLKGASTLIAAPDGRISVVTRGNPRMATGGMGDVLTGIIGGLLAQRVEPHLAARAGVFLHAAAGDRAAARRQGPLVASDLLDALFEAPAAEGTR